MAMPTDVGAVDTMIGFPAKDFEHYEFIRKQLKDSESAEFDFPVEYMFKGVPKEKYGADDPIGLTLGEMDAYGVEWGLIGCEGEVNRKALADHPDRFVATCQIDANDIMGAVRKIRHCKEAYDIRAVGTFPAGCFPPDPDRRRQVVPGVRHLLRAGHPRLRVRGGARPPAAHGLPAR